MYQKDSLILSEWIMTEIDPQILSCEKLLVDALKDPTIKLLLSGLKRAGCDFNPLRHSVCEPCGTELAGG